MSSVGLEFLRPGAKQISGALYSVAHRRSLTGRRSLGSGGVGESWRLQPFCIVISSRPSCSNRVPRGALARLASAANPCYRRGRPCLVAIFFCKINTVTFSFVFDKYCPIITKWVQKIRLVNYRQTVQLDIFLSIFNAPYMCRKIRCAENFKKNCKNF